MDKQELDKPGSELTNEPNCLSQTSIWSGHLFCALLAGNSVNYCRGRHRTIKRA
ncbi:hypothetical protein MGWOODY_Mmi1835 [hydrothermal vent metagenome]|uniref:Uncharacterized protein n=1 Tax=hydrothermal vent metagenome TaxID=652676 RepID=A0A160VDX1_9ZZZZ